MSRRVPVSSRTGSAVVRGCYSSDSAAAIEQAILDGVDVLNFSIGGGENPYTDIVSLAFLGAYERASLWQLRLVTEGREPIRPVIVDRGSPR